MNLRSWEEFRKLFKHAPEKLEGLFRGTNAVFRRSPLGHRCVRARFAGKLGIGGEQFDRVAGAFYLRNDRNVPSRRVFDDFTNFGL